MFEDWKKSIPNISTLFRELCQRQSKFAAREYLGSDAVTHHFQWGYPDNFDQLSFLKQSKEGKNKSLFET